MPRADDPSRNPPPIPPQEGRIISLDGKVEKNPAKRTYPAYGEKPSAPSRDDRSLVTKSGR
jgi:hypothetical protein